MATKTARTNTVPVTARALIQRINRKPQEDSEQIKTTRDGTRARQGLGEFYVVDWRINAVTRMDVDLADLGRELKVLADYEHLVTE